MANLSYSRGRRFEYRVRDWLKAHGFELVIRSAGSKTPWDIVALRQGVGDPWQAQVWLVQCKGDGKPGPAVMRKLRAAILRGLRNVQHFVVYPGPGGRGLNWEELEQEK